MRFMKDGNIKKDNTKYNISAIIFLLVLLSTKGYSQNDFEKGSAFYEKGDYKKAYELFSKHLEKNPNNAATLYNRALCCYYMGELGKSLSDLNKSIKLFPKKYKDHLIQAYLWRGEVYRELQDTAKYIADINNAYQLDSISIDMLLIRADMYSKLREYEKSNRDYEKVLQLDDAQHVAYAGLGMNRFTQHNYKESVRLLSKALKLSPNYYLVYNFRSIAYMFLEEYDSAIADFMKWIEVSENVTPDTYYLLASCYQEKGDYELAISNYEKAIDMNIGSSNCYVQWASLKQSKGEYDAAIQGFSKAIELEPNNVGLYYQRGWVYEFANRPEEALSDYNTAISIEPNNWFVYVNRGRLLSEIKRKSESKKDFNLILENCTTIESQGNYRQYALFYLGKELEAADWMQKIIKQYPTKENYYDAACLYSLMNKKELALEYLELAFRNGYKNFIHCEVDRDLKNIKKLPAFRILLGKYKNLNRG